jgi:RES domain-containing protein
MVWYRIVAKHRTARDEVLKSNWGRFHDDPEIEPTCYLADSLMTAWREVTARFGEVPADHRAFHVWRVTVPGVRLADLREPEELVHHQVTRAQILADPPPLRLKVVARKLRQQEAAYHGLIYQSVRNRPGGVCVALFLERVSELIVLEAVEDEEWGRFIADEGIGG